jgi:hypothetical protein
MLLVDVLVGAEVERRHVVEPRSPWGLVHRAEVVPEVPSTSAADRREVDHGHRDVQDFGSGVDQLALLAVPAASFNEKAGNENSVLGGTRNLVRIHLQNLQKGNRDCERKYKLIKKL